MTNGHKVMAKKLGLLGPGDGWELGRAWAFPTNSAGATLNKRNQIHWEQRLLSQMDWVSFETQL